MRYTPEQKAGSRTAILKAAGRIFREKGFSGAGIDGIASAAGLTSGSFYKHFAGKGEAVREVLKAGLERSVARVRKLQKSAESGPGDWVNDFATTYMSPEHVAAMGTGCSLPALTAEVAREDEAVRAVFTDGIESMLSAMVGEEPLARHADGRARAAAILALLSGGAALARAVHDDSLREEIAEAVRKSALLVAAAPLPQTPASKARWSPPE